MKPARLIPAERVAPLGQRFCASVSDAKLGKITVRPAPARPVPRPAQLAKLAGRLVAPSYRGSHGRVNPWAGHLARSSGGWSSKLPFGSVARQRKPVVQQKPIYKSRGPRQLELAPARQKTPAGRPYKGAAASMAGSFLLKAGWLGSTVQARVGAPEAPGLCEGREMDAGESSAGPGAGAAAAATAPVVRVTSGSQGGKGNVRSHEPAR